MKPLHYFPLCNLNYKFKISRIKPSLNSSSFKISALTSSIARKGPPSTFLNTILRLKIDATLFVGHLVNLFVCI